MTKITVMRWLFFSLIMLNLILLSILVYPHLFPYEGPKKIIIEKLHFDKAQTQAYQTLIDQHRKQIDAYDKQIREKKEQLYLTLQTPNDTAKKSQLIHELSQIQTEIEQTHYQHFEALRALCKPEQQADFNALTQEIARLFAPHHPPKK